MIHQIFYDRASSEKVLSRPGLISPLGVYDNRSQPNLAEHNTLCEWRAMYYVWKHHPTPWVGFTSWRHDEKGFFPALGSISKEWVAQTLSRKPIHGFCVRTLPELLAMDCEPTLRNQFVQWSGPEAAQGRPVRDPREGKMAEYHSPKYWDFALDRYRVHQGRDLGAELDWRALGEIPPLHTWCNAFVTSWDYFDRYMSAFSPIVLEMLENFGSQPTDLELSYICERLIILHNYVEYSTGVTQ